MSILVIELIILAIIIASMKWLYPIEYTASDPDKFIYPKPIYNEKGLKLTLLMCDAFIALYFICVCMYDNRHPLFLLACLALMLCFCVAFNYCVKKIWDARYNKEYKKYEERQIEEWDNFCKMLYLPEIETYPASYFKTLATQYIYDNLPDYLTQKIHTFTKVSFLAEYPLFVKYTPAILYVEEHFFRTLDVLREARIEQNIEQSPKELEVQNTLLPFVKSVRKAICTYKYDVKQSWASYAQNILGQYNENDDKHSKNG